MKTETKLYNYLTQSSDYDAWTDEQLLEILTISREGAVSPAKLRLVEDELKATNDSLERMIFERGELDRRCQALAEDNAVLNVNLEAAITYRNEMKPVVIAVEAAGWAD